MLDKDAIRQKVQAGLKKLCEGGTLAEHIAINLHMRYPTVQNWIAGRRVPSYPVIRQIEQIYGIKIL